MEWRGQQHAREAVESTASGATAATIACIIMDDRPDEGEYGTAHTGSDEEGHGRAYTGLIKLIKASRGAQHFQYTTRVQSCHRAIQLQE